METEMKVKNNYIINSKTLALETEMIIRNTLHYLFKDIGYRNGDDN